MEAKLLLTNILKIMKKIIFSLLTCIILFGTNAFAQDSISQKLLDASGNDIYLKNFPLELDAGEIKSFEVVLSKNSVYNFYLYQEYDKQLIFNINEKNDDSVEGGSIPVQVGVTKIDFVCPKTAAYFVKIKNLSNKKLKSNYLLTYFDKVISYNDDDEIIPITAIADGNKNSKSETIEKDFFFIVEEMPKFNGKSRDEFIKYLNTQIEYPQEAIDKKIQGRVYVQFIIDKSGYIKNAEVVKGVHPSIDQEALRIVYGSPKWEPGKQKGEPVDVVFTIPIIFKLK